MCLQVAMAYFVADAPWWKVLLAAYVVSGTASQNLFTAQHELSHYLAFRTPLYNRILSLASNCPLVVPTATAFRKYHQEHHSHLVRACSFLNVRPWCFLGMYAGVASRQRAWRMCCSETLFPRLCGLHSWLPSALSCSALLPF